MMSVSVIPQHRILTLPVPQVSNIFYPFNQSLEEEMERLFANLRIDTRAKPPPSVEDVMEEFRHNGQDFEYCPDGDAEMRQETALRRRKTKKPLPTECVFCKNNGEAEHYYRKHLLKDADGRVRCPVLRAYTCPICSASGDDAHTIKYCPMGAKTPSISTANAFKLLKNATGKRKMHQVVPQFPMFRNGAKPSSRIEFLQKGR